MQVVGNVFQVVFGNRNISFPAALAFANVDQFTFN